MQRGKDSDACYLYGHCWACGLAGRDISTRFRSPHCTEAYAKGYSRLHDTRRVGETAQAMNFGVHVDSVL